MWSKIIRNTVLHKNLSSPKPSTRQCSGPPPSLLRKYEHFQKDNGLPVHLKGGPMDRVLLGTTVIGIVFGLADGLWTIFQMARPKPKHK